MKKNILTISLLGLLTCAVLSFGHLAMAQPPDNIDINATLEGVVNWLFGILLTVAAVMLIFAGFMFATAAGDAEKIKKSRTMMIFALVGVVIAFASKGLVALVQTLIKT